MIRSLSAGSLLLLLSSACSAPLAMLRDQYQPPDAQHVVTATLESRSGRTYAAVVTIQNQSDQVLSLYPGMFRLESAPPTQFVHRAQDWKFQSGFQLPEVVSPGDTVHGEVLFELENVSRLEGPVCLVVALPDGDRRFTFEFF